MHINCPNGVNQAPWWSRTNSWIDQAGARCFDDRKREGQGKDADWDGQSDQQRSSAPRRPRQSWGDRDENGNPLITRTGRSRESPGRYWKVLLARSQVESARKIIEKLQREDAEIIGDSESLDAMWSEMRESLRKTRVFGRKRAATFRERKPGKMNKFCIFLHNFYLEMVF